MIINDVSDEVNEPVYLCCPFCKDVDFDLIGLKIHLLSGHCDDFNDLDIR